MGVGTSEENWRTSVGLTLLFAFINFCPRSGVHLNVSHCAREKIEKKWLEDRDSILVRNSTTFSPLSLEGFVTL